LPELDFGLLALSFLVLLFSLTVHESAHAWTADRLGDPTARRLGRVSFNPLVHIDPIGTVLLPVLAVASGWPIIGWAKPVPVNGHNLRDYRRDFMVIAAAGPASNLLLAVAGAAIWWLLAGAGEVGPAVSRGLLLLVYINVLLAFFNLLPVPPLDGGNVAAGLLPPPAADAFDRLRPFGFIVLYGLLLTGVFSVVVLRPALAVVRFLIP
jgi:Zn-dependent protease